MDDKIKPKHDGRVGGLEPDFVFIDEFLTAESFNDGDCIVCERGGRTIAGFKKGDILMHRRLPCGFVSFTHCENLRDATDFERQLVQEMEDGIVVYPGLPNLVDKCLPANQWGA